jgi:hypothetical protein
MYTNLSLLLRSSFLILLSTIFLTACESSDTADTGIGSGNSTATGVEMGDVTLLITDAPTSAYDEVNVVAESVSLVGEGHEAPLLKKHTRFNLLDLRNTFRKLSKSRCRVGTYSKVRFRIRDVELVKRNRDGTIAERVIPRLEKNMVDLNARAQFAVDRLRNLIVKLDLDADKSLSTDPETNEPVFNPDVTVDVDSVPTDTELPPQEVTPVLMNEQGVARNIQADSFQLCDPDLLSDCVQVNVGAETVVMDEVINVVGIGDITENTLLQVIGHLDVNTDAINALHVLKDGSRLNTYSGTLSGDVVNDSINFDVTAGAQAGSTYPVTPASLAGVYDSAGNVLDINALGDGVNVEVIGALSGFLPPIVIKPGVIIISTP